MWSKGQEEWWVLERQGKGVSPMLKWVSKGGEPQADVSEQSELWDQKESVLEDVWLPHFWSSLPPLQCASGRCRGLWSESRGEYQAE